VSRYGTIPAPGSALFVESAEPTDLETRVNAALQILAVAMPVLASVQLSGAGDGHSFVVELVGTQTMNAITLTVGTYAFNPSGVFAICYMAADRDQLREQRARAVAASGISSTDTVIDEIVAGASKGLRHMGLILYVKGTPPPPIPGPFPVPPP